MNDSVMPAKKNRRVAPLALIAAAAGAGLLALTMTGTLSGFAASITNSANTAGSGTLVMQEQSTGTAPVTCTSNSGAGGVGTNTATCATINKFGGSTVLVPGNMVSTDITIKNIGTANAGTFALTPGAACTQSNNGAVNGTATDLCAKLKVVITAGGTSIFNGTAATLAGAPAISITPAPAAGVSVPVNIKVTLDAAADNTYQGLAASLPLTWAFAS
ncbi:hypothetical protein GU243_08505 [Pseudarthrobacter psychrotolerans]|uniref:Uncharacterized protein n=1 Tax=Pseudarthrobacter psychrotolerans TaxID=2697569 RepID=A0A6P1NL43_9MICC|nr:hypothetical protein [Pseudarthrobacter psychrotolerans]QHK19763.1 hypothetical protein GU243_08505 [Pseudarthrobacter psychrotolerans]